MPDREDAYAQHVFAQSIDAQSELDVGDLDAVGRVCGK
jgi:hypothetical protein